MQKFTPTAPGLISINAHDAKRGCARRDGSRPRRERDYVEGMDVGELCMRMVVVASPDESAVDAARRMKDLHVGSLVVVEETPAGRRPVGIVTDRDLLFAALKETPLEALRLSQVMASDLLVARESESVDVALERMRTRGVRRLPVVDAGGMLQGILAYDDIVEWVGEELTLLAGIVRKERSRERGRVG